MSSASRSVLRHSGARRRSGSLARQREDKDSLEVSTTACSTCSRQCGLHGRNEGLSRAREPEQAAGATSEVKRRKVERNKNPKQDTKSKMSQTVDDLDDLDDW